MEGYDRNEALAWMMAHFDKRACPRVAAKAESYLQAAIAADLEYMEKSGVLEGKSYYDDDDAFEYLSEVLARKLAVKGDRAMDDLEDFIDHYMELQQGYMEEKGLLGWD